MNSSPESEDQQDEDAGYVDVTKEEVERLMERLLIALPSLRNLDNLDRSDFSQSAIILLKNELGKSGHALDAKKIADAMYPFLENYSWSRMAPALEEIIQDPTIQSNIFLLQNITDKRSPWWYATMGLLSG